MLQQLEELKIYRRAQNDDEQAGDLQSSLDLGMSNIAGTETQADESESVAPQVKMETLQITSKLESIDSEEYFTPPSSPLGENTGLKEFQLSEAASCSMGEDKNPSTGSHQSSSDPIALPRHKVIKSSLSRLGGPVQIVQEWKLAPLHQNGVNGSGVNIIILDTDIDGQYPPIGNKAPGTVVGLQKFVQGSIVDLTHGTIAATIAVGAKYDGFEGGVAPAATVGVCCVSLDGKDHSSQSVCSALQYLLMNNIRVDVISMSLGFEKIDEEIEKCINELTNQGVVCVAAAGNDGLYQTSVMFPASDKNVISVGSYQPTGHPSKFNPIGNIDVYAPGENLSFPGYEKPFQGTSFAAPAIAGLIALLIQLVRKLHPELERHIRNVNVLKRIFDYDLKARGKDLLVPCELLTKDPQELQRVIKSHIELEA